MKKILVLDISAIIYRSFFALINLRNSNGLHVGAVLGLVKQIDKAIKEFNPDCIVATKDVKRKELKRREIYPSYKENRDEMPQELVSQLEYVDKILNYHRIPIVKIDSYEADDVMASIAKKFSKENEIIIITGDKDLSQLVDENVTIALLGKANLESSYKILSNREDVLEYIDVYPEQIVDLFALMGDSSDGIPGIKGIGPKSAVKLLNEYNNLDNIYTNIENIKGSIKTKLEEGKEIAYISKKLATIYDDLKIDLTLEDLLIKEKDYENLKKIYTELEFKKEYEKLLDEISNKLEVVEDIEIEEKYYSTLFDFVEKINSEKKEISLYISNLGISYYDGKIAHYCYNISDVKENLFEKSISLNDISNNLNVIVYSSKEMDTLGIKFKNVFDVLLAYFTLSTDKIQKIENIILDKLGLYIEELEKKQIQKLSHNEFLNYSSNRLKKISYSLYNLKNILLKELKTNNVYHIYEEELRLVEVLRSMENKGIKIDINYFKNYEKELIDKKKKIEELIYLESGEIFNISSPKQLGEVLFEKMNLDVVKKNKRGYSTDVEVLEILKEKGIKIADLILEYREIEKLKTTYVEPLINLSINNRVHTTYNQTGTATGRLSSQNPNLQNIPTRTDEGIKIRAGFIAEENMKLVSFDYSQIELRVLAELSGDETLIKAYKDDLDLHDLTARKIFNLSKDEFVSKHQRNIAKVINFSVLYGKTAFGLSKELKISRSEADLYIKTYFNEYPKVKEFIDNILKEAKVNNYVETLYKTRRYVYDINSSNLNIREQAKRAAINTVIQGTAANIIKKVMQVIYDKLSLKFNLLLQVHDELIFEVKDEYLNDIYEIKEIMENTIKFEKVKLKVNYNIADNWGELK